MQVISQQSPSVVVSWSDMGLFNSMFYASGPSSFQSDLVCGTLIASSPTCGLPLSLCVDESVDGLCVAICTHGSVRFSREKVGDDLQSPTFSRYFYLSTERHPLTLTAQRG